MTVKEWLNRGYGLEREIRRITNERLKAYAQLFGKACKGSEKVQTSRINRTEEQYIKYLEYDEKLNKRIDELYDIKQEILTVIDNVEDNRLRELLIARYVNFQKWEEIADSFGYDVRHIFRLHRRALAEAEKKLIENEN